MSEANAWTIGTLRQEDFCHIENVLTERNILHQIVTPENFPADLKETLAPFDEWATQCVDLTKRLYMPSADITHCFVSTTLPNAFARITPDAPGKYFIAFLGGVTLMYPIFDTVLRDKDVRDFLELGELALDGDKTAHQNDAVTLNSLSFRWLAYHEIGHIKNGHLHLVAKDTRGLTAMEQMQASGDEDYNLTRHTLEMDADAFASGQVINEILSMDKELTADWTLFQTDERKIKSFYIAMYTMMRSFESRDWTVANQFSFSHPHAVIRMIQLAAWGQAFSQAYNLNIKPEQWGKLAIQCVAVCERSMRQRGFPRLPASLIDSLVDPSYVRRILARWAKIRPALLPHLLGGTLVDPQEFPA
jgi:hypothetical protein